MNLKTLPAIAICMMTAFTSLSLVGCGEREAVVVTGETDMTAEEMAEEQAGVGGIDDDY